MSCGVLSPNLTQKILWKVSQIAVKKCSCTTVLGGLSVNLNHLIIYSYKISMNEETKDRSIPNLSYDK